MENQINELLGKIDYLEKLINTVQTNVISNIELTWAILGVVVATAGVALYALCKIWVNLRVEKELSKELEIITKKLKEESIRFIKDNPPVAWSKSTGVVLNLELKDDIVYNTIDVLVDKSSGGFPQEVPNILEVYYIKDDVKIIIDQYTITRRNMDKNYDELVVKYKVPIECLKLQMVYYNLIYFNNIYYN